MYIRSYFLQFTIFLIIVFISFPTTAQDFYDGPASGNVTDGHTFNTSAVVLAKPEVNIRMKFFNHGKPKLEVPDEVTSDAETRGNYIQDPAYNRMKKTNSTGPFILQEYEGPDLNTDGRYLRIPPDSYCAAGPDHVVLHVNSLIFFIDKETGQQTQIDPMVMFNYIESISPFDPKISYDHFDKRWISVWLQVNDVTSEAFYLIAVSDDSDPNGTWYTWALPSNVNGMTMDGSWADFQGVGFDDKAIYLTSNQFEFAGNYLYSKIRIIDKANVYVNGNPGTVTWNDIWNMKYDGFLGSSLGIRPTIMMDADEYYYFASLRYGGGTSFYLYRLSDPITNPVLSGFKVNTSRYQNTEDIDVEQLGDNESPLEHGGLALRFEAVFTNGKVHIVHPAKYETRIGIRYLSISTDSKTAVSDMTLGTPEHYYLYPGLAVNQSDDVVITYSRVSANEYAGAYYTFIPSDVGTFTGSSLLMEGKSSYELYLNDPSKRNRWGDYSGAWVDPEDENTFWVFSEYTKRFNTWGTRLAAVRYRGFDQPYLRLASSELDFGTAKINSDGKTRNISITNFGSTDLIISNANITGTSFELSGVSLPVTIPSLDTVDIGIKYSPVEHDESISEILTLTTNDPDNTEVSIQLEAKGFEMIDVTKGLLYASTGNVVGSLGRIATIDRTTGSSSVIAKSGFRPVSSLTINPVTNELYGLNKATNTDNPNILMIRGNDVQGMAYDSAPLDIKAFTFDNSGLMHVITYDDDYYIMNINTLNTTFVSTLNIGVSAVTCNFAQNKIYLMRSDDISFTELYTLSADGQTSLVGSTGLSKPIQAMTFDSDGELFGSMGDVNEFSTLVSINPSTGSAVEIGNMNLREVLGIAFALDGITGISESIELPEEFVLRQNYPNPFNPATNIDFNIPEQGSVKLVVYNTLGEKVITLIDKQLQSGLHNVEITPEMSASLSSGTYIYKLQFTSVKGKSFSTSRKMILLK